MLPKFHVNSTKNWLQSFLFQYAVTERSSWYRWGSMYVTKEQEKSQDCTGCLNINIK